MGISFFDVETGCFWEFLTIGRDELRPHPGRLPAASGPESGWIWMLLDGFGVGVNECGPPQAGRTLVGRWLNVSCLLAFRL